MEKLLVESDLSEYWYGGAGSGQNLAMANEETCPHFESYHCWCKELLSFEVSCTVVQVAGTVCSFNSSDQVIIELIGRSSVVFFKNFLYCGSHTFSCQNVRKLDHWPPFNIYTGAYINATITRSINTNVALPKHKCLTVAIWIWMSQNHMLRLQSPRLQARLVNAMNRSSLQ